MDILSIRRITGSEIKYLLESTASVGWDIAPEDVRIMIENPHSGALLARMDGTVAGTGCWFGNDDGSVIFISLITVKDEFRRQGIASKIMHSIINENPQAKTFRLLASDMGKPLYEKMGFKVRRPVEFISGTAAKLRTLGNTSQVRSVAEIKPWMVQMDAEIVSPKRAELLKAAVSRNGSLIFETADKTGFALGRRDEKSLDISMIQALTLQNALDLAASFAHGVSDDLLVSICVADAQKEFRDSLLQNGFFPAQKVTDMVLGSDIPESGPGCYALFSYIG